MQHTLPELITPRTLAARWGLSEKTLERSATPAMGGAATAIDKTDWTPLAGKTVTVWPDHDEAGARYADAVIQKLMRMGATVRRVSVPQDKPAKWDAADAVAEGFDVEALLRTSQPVTGIATATPALDITRWRAADRFIGQPQQRRWLVEGVFPQAQAALIAASGGVGKSFLLLALTRRSTPCGTPRKIRPGSSAKPWVNRLSVAAW